MLPNCILNKRFMDRVYLIISHENRIERNMAKTKKRKKNIFIFFSEGLRFSGEVIKFL